MVKYLVYVVLILFCAIGWCVGKNVSSEKPVESIDGLYLRDIAERLSVSLNKTNDEELGVSYIKVS